MLVFSTFFSLLSAEGLVLPIIFIPFLSFFFAIFSYGVDRFWLLRRLTTLMLFNIFFSFYLFCFTLFRENFFFIDLGLWISSGTFFVNWTFLVDPLSSIMFVVVSLISGLVHLYSLEYMKNEPHLNRFMSYLSLFTFFMLILVASDHLLGLFFGWEGIGLCSYLLIGFWTTRIQANKAAIKAMIVNRIADLFLIMGVAATAFFYHTLDFSIVLGSTAFFSGCFMCLSTFTFPVFSVITFLFFLGAMGKSAQIGLHTWLPDAMEGPTPVSALIHAATLVTAGIFLIIRSAVLFEQSPTILLFICLIGAATAFFAATSGLMQSDIKKVIAYSTCSQLGYMALTCGLSQYQVSFFHLTNHACFKALLFLSAGSLIHSVANEQDLRRYGSLARLLPYSYIMLLIGSIALMGFPFLTGFYSKDLILEVAGATETYIGLYAWCFGILTAFCTAFYSLRVIYLAFFTSTNITRATLPFIHELPFIMAIPLGCLSVASIFMGYYGRDLFVGWGTPIWNGTLAVNFFHTASTFESEFLPLIVKSIPLLTSLLAFLIIFGLPNLTFIFIQKNVLFQVFRFISNKWYFDSVYNYFLNRPFLRIAYYYPFLSIDKGILELFGPTGLFNIVAFLGNYFCSFQNGKVWFYGLFLILTLFYVLLFFLF